MLILDSFFFVRKLQLNQLLLFHSVQFVSKRLSVYEWGINNTPPQHLTPSHHIFSFSHCDQLLAHQPNVLRSAVGNVMNIGRKTCLRWNMFREVWEMEKECENRFHHNRC